MIQDRYFSDEELVAFLDGEDDFAPVDEITESLKTDSTLARRIDALRLDKDEIVQSFSTLKIGTPPKLPEQTATSTGYRNLIAASLVAVAVGFGAGFSTSELNQHDWRDYVASYQALYTNSTLNHVIPNPALQQDELTRVTAAIGKQIDVGKLNISSEVEYKRAQVLGYKGKALIQLAFLDSTGQPIALCIIRSDKNPSKNVQLGTMEGMSSASWARSGYEFILIGGTDQSLISRLASEFSNTI